MFKRLAIFCLILTVFSGATVEAKTKKNKKSRGVKSSRQYRPSKHSRKTRRFSRRSNGPDLKTITTESSYKEDPSNGVTPLETKQPGL